MASVCCAFSSSDMTLPAPCDTSAIGSGIGGCCASRATTLKPKFGRVYRSKRAHRIAGVSIESPSRRPHVVRTPSNGIRGPRLGSSTPSSVSPQGPKSWTTLGMMLAVSISLRKAPRNAGMAPRRSGIRASESRTPSKYLAQSRGLQLTSARTGHRSYQGRQVQQWHFTPTFYPATVVTPPTAELNPS